MTKTEDLKRGEFRILDRVGSYVLTLFRSRSTGDLEYTTHYSDLDRDLSSGHYFSDRNLAEQDLGARSHNYYGYRSREILANRIS